MCTLSFSNWWCGWLWFFPLSKCMSCSSALNRQLFSVFCIVAYDHTYTHTQTFNDLFSRTTWVGQYQKDKSFWILLKQEMMGWQWHYHMQIICTSLQTDNHANTSSLTGCSSCCPTSSINALKAQLSTNIPDQSHYIYFQIINQLFYLSSFKMYKH